MAILLIIRTDDDDDCYYINRKQQIVFISDTFARDNCRTYHTVRDCLGANIAIVYNHPKLVGRSECQAVHLECNLSFKTTFSRIFL